MFRVVLVDDHELIRAGLRRAFELADDFEVVGEAATAAAAVSRVAAAKPDVVTLDVRLPDGDGIDVAKRLRKEHAGLGIVILTMYPGDDQLFNALDAGANAFVAKSAPVSDVVAAARQAATNSGSFTSSDLAAALRRRSSETVIDITPRELDVLRLLAQGFSVGQVSRRLGISDSTTKTHIAKIYHKLGAGNRAEALMAAIRLGIIEAPTDR
jgi:DNA-binding NarL/FixJ family response regulator